MPDIGAIQVKHNRIYAFVNPNPMKGPGTWRLGSETGIGINGGGSINSVSYDFKGTAPIDVDVVPSMVDGPTEVTTSMDITQLADRTK